MENKYNIGQIVYRENVIQEKGKMKSGELDKYIITNKDDKFYFFCLVEHAKSPQGYEKRENIKKFESLYSDNRIRAVVSEIEEQIKIYEKQLVEVSSTINYINGLRKKSEILTKCEVTCLK